MKDLPWTALLGCSQSTAFQSAKIYHTETLTQTIDAIQTESVDHFFGTFAESLCLILIGSDVCEITRTTASAYREDDLQIRIDVALEFNESSQGSGAAIYHQLCVGADVSMLLSDISQILSSQRFVHYENCAILCDACKCVVYVREQM